MTSTILLLKSIFVFMLSVDHFSSKRPSLSEIFYSVLGLFLWRKSDVIQNILYYVWSISVARKIATLHRSVVRNFGGISQIRLQFFPRQNIKKQYYGLPQGNS